MRRGFTVLELLVAALLLGMLVTILTMIFNQSSIAWRTGVAGVADLDEVRDNMASLREEADNIYVWNGEPYRLLSLWNDQDKLRTRSIDAEGGDFKDSEKAQFLRNKGSFSDDMKLSDIHVISIGAGAGSVGIDTYTVNVISAGPDKKFETTYDNIMSFPDDFDL